MPVGQVVCVWIIMGEQGYSTGQVTPFELVRLLVFA